MDNVLYVMRGTGIKQILGGRDIERLHFAFVAHFTGRMEDKCAVRECGLPACGIQ